MSTAGLVALVGSGEYLEVMAPLEARLLASHPGTYVQIATAAVPDGPDVVARWHRLGTAQAERIGATPVIIPLTSRDEADERFLPMLEGAGLIYLSGGHPSFLANCLRDTPLWRAIVAQHDRGVALAGCSAGAMVMASRVPSLRHPQRGEEIGLGLLSGFRVIPHFDAFRARTPDFLTRFLTSGDDVVVGVDENTALVGGPHEWEVWGEGSAWIKKDSGFVEHAAGETLRLA